jgi:hypothetical protein
VLQARLLLSLRLLHRYYLSGYSGGFFYAPYFIQPVLRIRIRMFLGLLDPDPLVQGRLPDPAPDPSIIKQR